MEPTIQEVLVEVERGVRAYRAFEHAQKLLTFLANVEQLGREAELRTEQAQARASEAEALAEQRILRATQDADAAALAAANAGEAIRAKYEAEQRERERTGAEVIAKWKAEGVRLMQRCTEEKESLVKIRQEIVTETQALHDIQRQVSDARDAKNALLRA